ncbi:MAG: hypothetical protein A2Y62_13170 [Candidatus Fischerbacteria bacterium RBG_13_37_8]|uniref:Uncharacterized protein n=1 Tax=Candidatus Fischerbacteria bacterium RBG_13_37_8 TaxID=1817863 RepID=A0A1F5VN93_9BACT|nr:MAG: hypothetical protein A2Y62_13170 [Candidatus Fischerbacteria bacterium RBG_13_37_8]
MIKKCYRNFYLMSSRKIKKVKVKVKKSMRLKLRRGLECGLGKVLVYPILEINYPLLYLYLFIIASRKRKDYNNKFVH